jgi:hypothetical protein
MPTYELYFGRTLDTGEQWLLVGDAFRYEGELWRVEEVEPGGRRIRLRPWPDGTRLPRVVKGEREASADES